MPNQPERFRHAKPGNAIGEYALIGLLLLGLCILAVSQLGSSLKGQLDGFEHSLAYKKKPAAISGASNVGVNSSNTAGGGNGTSAGKGANGLDSALAGAWVNPQDTAQRIQVAGSNGTTRELLGNLEKWIQDMRSAGQIDDAQANLLQTMANRGHELADAQQALETSIAKGQSSFMYNGKAYTPATMAEAIGLDFASNSKWDLDPTYAKPAISPFAQAYQTAKAGGALSNPDVNQKVSQLVFQIAAASDALSWNADTFLNKNIPASQWPSMAAQFNAGTAKDFTLNLGGADISFQKPVSATSMLTNGNSGQICNMGSGKDSGHNCAN